MHGVPICGPRLLQHALQPAGPVESGTHEKPSHRLEQALASAKAISQSWRSLSRPARMCVQRSRILISPGSRTNRKYSTWPINRFTGSARLADCRCRRRRQLVMRQIGGPFFFRTKIIFCTSLTTPGIQNGSTSRGGIYVASLGSTESRRSQHRLRIISNLLRIASSSCATAASWRRISI
jgi:hypothetical protein